MEKKKVTRKLRDRKVRIYTDDWQGDADDEIEGPRAFDLDEKLQTDDFNKPHLIKQLKGTEFNLAWIQQNGFTVPLLFKDKAGLGIRIPQPTFSVSDVRTLVGSRRMLDVMDVRTQKNMEMTMKEWEEYYCIEDKDRLLNVISLEFSHTKLENYVESPTVVRQLDWVDRVWPRHLKNMQTESTNVMDEMMYPKVQKYCLMSVEGCYTDFHVDFGGTSVWYHILKGGKVFWLIPPTDKNLELYQSWVLSGKQGEFFFGDNVQDCSRVVLEAGDTFFIPSGWIHAVHTPKDSLVFGGNFLHSFGIEKQLKIAMVEETTKVPQKFRYPFFTEMLWYTLERYVNCLIGLSFIRLPSENGELNPENPLIVPQVIKKPLENVHLSPQELLGLKAIVLYLHQLPLIRKNVPALIFDPVALLRSIRTIIEMHRYDSPQRAVTGRPILVWPDENPNDVGKIKPHERKPRAPRAPKNTNLNNLNQATVPVGTGVNNNGVSKTQLISKRVRCHTCQSCKTVQDCKSCSNCLTNSKLKDNSQERRNCLMRECMTPLLAPHTVCSDCGKDGWGQVPLNNFHSNYQPKTGSNLMECTKCFQIIHLNCIKTTPTKGFINEDLPNSWECPYCVDKSLPVRIAKRKSLEERRTSYESTQNCGNNSPLAIPSTSNSNPIVSSSFSQGCNKQEPQKHFPSSSSIIIPTPTSSQAALQNSFLSAAGKVEFAFGLKNESFERTAPIETPLYEPPKSVRDDEKIVQEKLAQVVRRKSVEDSKTKSPSKIKPKPKQIKITPAKGKGGAGKSLVNLKPSKQPSTNKQTENNEEACEKNQINNSQIQPPKRRESSPDILVLPIRKKIEKPTLKKKESFPLKKGDSKDKPGKIGKGNNNSRSSTSTEEKGPPPSKKLKKEKSEKNENEDEEEEEEEGKKKDKGNKDKVEKSPLQSPVRNHYRSELSIKIMNGSSKTLKKPTNVVRPAFFKINEDSTLLQLRNKRLDPQEFLRSQFMLKIFHWLDVKSLNRCMSVSKDWNQLAVTPTLWHSLDLTHRPITADLLKGVVRRQPTSIRFDWTNISKQQLIWIISRLPQLKELSLKGLTWNSVQALKSCSCTTLTSLDLGYISGLTDSLLREILAPPIDSRSGSSDSKSRLVKLRNLCLAGASLSDVSLRYVTQHAGSVTRLDLSCCSRITDAGIAQLGAPDSPSLENLTHLNISGCPQLTNISLDHLRRCRNMAVLDIRNIPMINYTGLTKYLSQVNTAEKGGDKTKREEPTVLTVHSDFHSMQKPKCAINPNSSQQHPGPPPGFSGSLMNNSASINTSKGPSTSIMHHS